MALSLSGILPSRRSAASTSRYVFMKTQKCSSGSPPKAADLSLCTPASHSTSVHRDRPLVGGLGARYRLENMAIDWIDAVLKAAGKRPLSALQMSVQDLSLLQNECTAFARHLYPNHRDVFQVYMTKARILFPKFNPTYPWSLSALSRCVGYENAEAVAQLVRRPKKLFQTFLQKIQLKGMKLSQFAIGSGSISFQSALFPVLDRAVSS
jgi:hypothetical protein